MNVLAFKSRQESAPWSESEMRTLLGGLSSADASCEWEIGTTENGDAQLYVMGPLPDQDCYMCVSRIGRHYILEDGAGRVIFEHSSLPLLTLRVTNALRSRRWGVVARIALLWFTVRSAIQDKVSPLITESEEMLVHLAPQLAAFA